MKITTFLTLSLLLIISEETKAQVSLKTEYLGTSSYKDNDGNKLGTSKGSAKVFQADIKIPVSIKKTKDSLDVIWAVDLSGAYASLANKNLERDLVLPNILDFQFSLYNIRQLTKKWSLIAFAGAGIYTDETHISKVGANSILGNGGAIFVRKINPNLQLGGGLALTNALGYPMLFPAIYLNYDAGEKYTFHVSMLSGFEASAGYNINKKLTLSLVGEINGQSALLKKENKDVIFTHQYIVAGVRPEIKFNKHLSLPITLGVNAMRFAYFTDRNLKSIFSDQNAGFALSPYAAAEINFKF